MTAWITLSEKFSLSDCLWEIRRFHFTRFWFISIIYLRSILFEFFILFIFMFFGQVYLTTFSFTWWIVITISLRISITFVVYLMPKRWGCFFRTTFFTSVQLFSFALFLGLTSSWIGCFLLIELSGDFFLLFLQRNTKSIWCFAW